MYLLDTHTFLWYVSANPNQVSCRGKKIAAESTNDMAVVS